MTDIFEDGDFRGQIVLELLVQLGEIDGFDGNQGFLIVGALLRQSASGSSPGYMEIDSYAKTEPDR